MDGSAGQGEAAAAYASLHRTARQAVYADGGIVDADEANEFAFDAFCAVASETGGSRAGSDAWSVEVQRAGLRFSLQVSDKDAAALAKHCNILIDWLKTAAPERLAAAASRGSGAAGPDASRARLFGGRFKSRAVRVAPLNEQGAIQVKPPQLPGSSAPGTSGPGPATGTGAGGEPVAPPDSAYPAGSAHWLLALCAEHVASLPREQQMLSPVEVAVSVIGAVRLARKSTKGQGKEARGAAL